MAKYAYLEIVDMGKAAKSDQKIVPLYGHKLIFFGLLLMSLEYVGSDLDEPG